MKTTRPSGVIGIADIKRTIQDGDDFLAMGAALAFYILLCKANLPIPRVFAQLEGCARQLFAQLAERQNRCPHLIGRPADGQVIPRGDDADAVDGENLGHGGPGLVGLQVLRLARGEEVGGRFGRDGLVAGGREVVRIEPGVFVSPRAVEVGVVDPTPWPPPRFRGWGCVPLPRVRGWGRGMGARQHLLQSSKHRVHVLEHLLIRKPHHAITQALQVCLAHLVVFFLRLVNWPIYLDNQARFAGVKVHDEGANGVLTAKLHTQLVEAQVLPQGIFGRSGIFAHFASIRL